jgi:hypothetical protein
MRETLFNSTTLIALYYCVELIRNGIWKVFNGQDWVGRVLKYLCKCTGKAIPLPASKGPESSRRLRLLYFKTIGT